MPAILLTHPDCLIHEMPRHPERPDRLRSVLARLVAKVAFIPLILLVEDAIAVSSERYGDIVEISGSRVTTSTGVEITLHWSNMSLAQSGRDTRLIDNLYKIHYLQWSGRPLPDTILGVAGIVMLLLSTVLGIASLVWSRKK